MPPKKSSALTSDVRHLTSGACDRKLDPYATRAHKQFDALLLLIIAAMIFIAFRGAAKDRAHRAAAVSSNADTQLTQVASK